MPARQNAIEARKQPRQSRAASTVDTIVEAAARILEKNGLPAFNTNAIAEKAGVSIGSLYQYFPAKEALLVELIRRKRAELLSDMRAVALNPRASDLRKAIDGFLKAALAHQLARPALARSLEYAETTLPIDAETRTLKREIVVAIAQVLSAHGVKDADIAARDLAALTRGMIDAAGMFGETDQVSLERRVKRAVYGYLGMR